MSFNFENPNHLLIGLGGTGGLILKSFKKRLYREFPDDKVREVMTPAIEFLYVDSTRNDLMNDQKNDPTWNVSGRCVSFTESEFLNIKDGITSITQVLDNVNNYPGLRNIVRNGEAMKQTVGEIAQAAGQKRRAGRIMFACNCAKYMDKIASQYSVLKSRTNLDSLHIHIFTGLAGGTGSGAIIDAVAQARKRYPDAEIDVYAMVPEKDIPANFDKGRYRQNGYAALKELNGLNVGLFLPCDVITGDEHIMGLDKNAKKQFSLMLFSNVNNNGVVVDSRKVLPDLVADALYQRLFLPKTEETNEFFRTWSCENIDDFLIEFSEKAKNNEGIRARTKAVSSFGIKRISYPEQRIEEHISYSVAEKVVSQMKFNNFKEEGVGYVDEPVKRDFSEITKSEANLKKWNLDEVHLTLEERILETDKKYPRFKEFWNDTALFYSYEDAKGNSSQPLMEIETHCEDVFKNNFRLKQGVEDYYKDKSAEKPIREQSAFIIDQIEKDLFNQWVSGAYSMYDLTRICESIIEYIKKALGDNEKLQEKCRENINVFTEEKVDNVEAFNHLGLAARAVGKSSRTFSDHQQILIDLYCEKTMECALSFRYKLLLRLKTVFEEFASQINLFNEKLSKAQAFLVKSVTERTKNKDKIDERETTIEVYEENKMFTFESNLLSNKNRMDEIATVIRKQIVGERSFAHFGDLADSLNESSLVEISDSFVVPQIRAIHENDDTSRNDRILGMNVLQQLKKMFDNGLLGNDLTIFTRKIVNNSGVFLKLSDQEMNKKLANNIDPMANQHSIYQRSYLVVLPKTEGDEKLKKFSTDLQSAFKNSFANAERVKFFDQSDRKNELSVIEVDTCFPIRCLEWMPFFRSEYEKLVDGGSDIEKNQNRILLHSEGDGRNLPSLEGESKVLSVEESVSKLIFAAALGFISFDKDENEEEGWCTVAEDEWGSKIVRLISKSFTEILRSEELSEDDKSALFDRVDDYFENNILKKSEKDDIAAKIKSVMVNYVAKEVSPSSPVYQMFSNAAKEDMAKLK